MDNPKGLFLGQNDAQLMMISKLQSSQKKEFPIRKAAIRYEVPKTRRKRENIPTETNNNDEPVLILSGEPFLKKKNLEKPTMRLNSDLGVTFL